MPFPRALPGQRPGLRYRAPLALVHGLNARPKSEVSVLHEPGAENAPALPSEGGEGDCSTIQAGARACRCSVKELGQPVPYEISPPFTDPEPGARTCCRAGAS